MCKKTYITFTFLFLAICGYTQIDSVALRRCVLSPDLYNGAPVYKIVTKMPEYRGGMGELLKLISKNTVYSNSKESLSSVIHTTFVVDTLGNIQNVCVITNRNELDDQEKQIVNVLQNAQNWTVGVLNEKKVCVRFTIPIRICLK